MILALIGYGRMGKTLERVAKEEGHRVAAVYTDVQPVQAKLIPREVEVCVDFSLPDAVPTNVAEVARAGRPMVIGTTGWYQKLPEVEAIVREAGIGLIYAPNFSLGVNLFFRLVEAAAQLYGKLGTYDCGIHEIHHAGKADSPSGTALKLAELVVRHWAGKAEVLADRPPGRIGPHQLHVTSTRCGTFPGEHILYLDSPDDTIELHHRARGREAFARGALRAAEWIRDRRGLFTLDDMLEDLLR
ncbi:MAG: 4-hydroxy-tetrahydrodipicolinate reductase [candidate division KSB1 bacterium]|nr:4-hydroxy-tetrahydrodipicolinate reductase [candidate division KSB1 bacterium]